MLRFFFYYQVAVAAIECIEWKGNKKKNKNKKKRKRKKEKVETEFAS